MTGALEVGDADTVWTEPVHHAVMIHILWLLPDIARPPVGLSLCPLWAPSTVTLLLHALQAEPHSGTGHVSGCLL